MDKKVGGRQEELAELAARSEREWSFELTEVGALSPRLRNDDSGRAEVRQARETDIIGSRLWTWHPVHRGNLFSFMCKHLQ